MTAFTRALSPAHPTRKLLAAALALALLLSLLPAGQLAAQRSTTGEVDASLAHLDLNGDGLISNSDIMQVTSAWESRRISGDVCSGPSPADVNGDGCVDIADIQMVAANVGISVNEPPAVDASAPEPPGRGNAPGSRALLQAGAIFVVTTTSDAPDNNPGDGVCQISGGGCSLRAAIDEANLMAGANTIDFNIPGDGPHVINANSPASDEPAYIISDESGPTIINGYSQPGASPNTHPAVSNAVIKVHIKGPREANTSVANYQSIDGVRVFSGGNEFRGLAFTHFRRNIWFSGNNANNNVIAGTFIGTDPAGQTWYDAINAVEGRGGDNGAYGIWLSDGASHNRIGGTDPADRTIVSGNANDGAGGRNEGTEHNQFIGNLIGLSPDGTRRVRNWGDGMDLNYGMAHTQIGGTSAAERNVISGNHGEGIEISHDPNTAFNQVVGNYFGVSPDGNTAASGVHRNTGYAISLEDSASDNIIGPGNVMANNDKGGIEIYGSSSAGNQVFGNRIGVTVNGSALGNRGPGIRMRFGASETTIGPDNIIANNSDEGVLVIDGSSQFNTITRNSIHTNGSIGIDLGGTKDTGGDGVTPNDGTWGSGPNQRVDFPVISQATTTNVSGTSFPGYRVEVFVADSSSGQHGEGRTYVGFGMADGSGDFNVAVSGVVAGNVVTATGTDSAGNTSEFSLNVDVSGGTPNTPPSVDIVSPSDGAAVSGTTTVSVNASDNEDATGALAVQVRIDGGAWQAASWNAGTGRYEYAWNTTTAGNGNHTIEARATDSANVSVTDGPITVMVANEAVPNFTLPALIQIEDYNDGGEGVGYHDTTSGNTGGKYRDDDVDIQTCTDSTTPAGQTCYNVGWTEAGEWLAYSVRVEAAGDYTFALRVATPSSGRSVQLQLNGSNLGSSIAIPNTGGYQAWTTVSVVRQLPAGDHELRLVINQSNMNLNYLNVSASDETNSPPTVSIATPASGATVSGTTTVGVNATDDTDPAGTLAVGVSIDGGAWQAASWNAGANLYEYAWDTTAVANGDHTIEARAIDSANAIGTASPIDVTVSNDGGLTAVPLPATIQAEDYIDYYDTTPGNTGGAYRDDDVDIGICSDGPDCFNVGWTITGEWLSYSVSSVDTATYTIELRYASPYAGRRVRIEVDGTALPQVSLVASGGWDTWRTATIATTQLSAGQHTIRLLIDRDGLNVNRLSFTS